jgi:hypothetical protein
MKRKKMQPWAFITGIIYLMICSLAHGAEPPDEQWGTLSENVRWTIDTSISMSHGIDDDDQDYEGFVGLDLLKVISTDTRDIGSFIAQLYLMRIQDREKPRPGFYDSESDWAFLPRNVYFDYTGLSRGQFNLRVGHIMPPFGLRYVSNTTGTLRQLITGPNLGLKIDYGLSTHGRIPMGSYHVSFTRGSGVEYKSDGDPYAVSGRIATPSNKQLMVGLSGFKAEMLTPKGLLSRTRFGLDLRTYYGPIDYMMEVSYGHDQEETAVLNGFGELSWSPGIGDLLVYTQGKYFSVKPDGVDEFVSRTFATVGVRYQLGYGFIAAANYEHPLELPEGMTVSPQVRFQLRHRL